MSVINKMLRDLDSRQAGNNTAEASPPLAHTNMTAGTVVLKDIADGAPSQPPKKIWGLMLVLSLLMAGVGLAVWTNQRPTKASDVGVVAVSAVLAPVGSVSTATTAKPTVLAPPPAMPPAAPVSTVAAVPVMPQIALTGVVAAPTVSSQLSLKAEPATTAAEPALRPRVKPETRLGQPRLPVMQLKEASEFSSFQRVNRLGPSAQRVVSDGKAVLPAASAVAAEAPKLRQMAVQDVLSQSQERWTLGERPQAIALLDTAIGRLEASPTGNTAALAVLVREYVRLTLIQGQTSAAWTVLSQSEQALADVADIWALRGNVAQRLGLHPEAVRAYLKGLELRPGEPRWMLGAAVSLAAQGQLGPAADLADKARLAGALRPDVSNYLRQLGVVIRSD